MNWKTLKWGCGHADTWPAKVAEMKKDVIASRDCLECRKAKAEAKRAQVEAEQEKEWAAAEVRRIEARARDPRSDEEIYQARVIADFAEARRQGWGCE